MELNKIHPRKYNYRSEFISKKEIDRVVKYVKDNYNLKFLSNFKGKSNNELNRKGCHIPNNNFTKNFYQSVYNCLINFNQDWGYELTHFECLVYMEYLPSSIGLNWHLDVGDSIPFSQRKISFSIGVNSPSEWKGGTLEIWQDAYNVKINTIPGSITAFPSYLLHRVTPIDSGVRKVIVGWASGNPYR